MIVDEIPVPFPCDGCGKHAATRWRLPSGQELQFCGHHTKTSEQKLEQLGAFEVLLVPEDLVEAVS